MTESVDHYTCINCGAEIKELYKKYSATVLKLLNCRSCQQVADKYIEYDPVIVIIDLILLRKEAYRHILYNTKFQTHWKLAIMLQIMEAYSEWIFTSPKTNRKDVETKMLMNDEDFNTGNLEFYKIGLKIMFRTLCFITVILLLTVIYNLILRKYASASTKVSLVKVWKAIVLSNFGLFLLLPSLIWDNTAQEFHLTFVSLYTTLSQLLAYTVVCNCSKLWSIFVIIFSYNFKAISSELYNKLSDILSNYYSQMV